MGNEASAKEYSKDIKNSLLRDILPWKCTKCDKSNESNPKFCDECFVANPILNPPSFVTDVFSSKKESDDDTKSTNDIKSEDQSQDSKLKQSLLDIETIRCKLDKYFTLHAYKAHNNVSKPLVLPVIHISNDDNYIETIDYNISLLQKYKFEGVWLIDHNFGNAMHLVTTIKRVRKKYPKLWIGANFLGFDLDSLIPFLIKNGLILNHTLKKKSKSDNILNGLWVDNGGIRITKEHEHRDDDNQKYNFNLAAFRALQLKHYGIKDFLYFGGIDFKYQGQVHKTKDVEAYRKEIRMLGTFASSGFMDVVCTSGKGTGLQIDIDKIKAFRESTNHRSLLAIASGVTPQNIIQYIGYADFILIATGVSSDFHTFDEQKMKQLRDAIENWKPVNK